MNGSTGLNVAVAMNDPSGAAAPQLGEVGSRCSVPSTCTSAGSCGSKRRTCPPGAPSCSAVPCTATSMMYVTLAPNELVADGLISSSSPGRSASVATHALVAPTDAQTPPE